MKGKAVSAAHANVHPQFYSYPDLADKQCATLHLFKRAKAKNK